MKPPKPRRTLVHTDLELKALLKLLSWDRGEIKWGEVITAVEKARTK